ncbi:MAG: hypothetical protein I8H75_01965 [Myxococcaceae bacterium]|nr:hypothetical protein [Myxococcaceae bacterium]MBH2006103.1 hypothetical protein [Myxococcaceae bacterium]
MDRNLALEVVRVTEGLRFVSKADIAVQDVLTQHRSTGEPVDRLVGRLTRSRGLGSRDRRLVGDRVFDELRNKPWPTWFTQQITPELEQALRQRAKPNLAVDRRHMTREEALQLLNQAGIIAKPSRIAETGLILEERLDLNKLAMRLQQALWWMDEGSQRIALEVQADPSDRVLDLCAGAGGKTRMILATGASITMVDSSPQRLGKIKGVQRFVADGRTLTLPLFDWILLDAPCSGTGTLRRSPDLFGRLQENSIPRYALLQNELAKNAHRLLKPNGKLVYATCSLLSAENHRDFVGFDRIEHRQLLPSADGCDGFYYAIFKKQL